MTLGSAVCEETTAGGVAVAGNTGVGELGAGDVNIGGDEAALGTEVDSSPHATINATPPRAINNSTRCTLTTPHFIEVNRRSSATLAASRRLIVNWIYLQVPHTTVCGQVRKNSNQTRFICRRSLHRFFSAMSVGPHSRAWAIVELTVVLPLYRQCNPKPL